MNVTVLYVGSSLLAPLRQAEREINRDYGLDLRIAAYNFGAALAEDEWREVERDLSAADVVFVIHVMDGENAARLLPALERYKARHHAVVVINCMPDLMRRTRMGRLDFGRMFKITLPSAHPLQRKTIRSGTEDEENFDALAIGTLRRASSTSTSLTCLFGPLHLTLIIRPIYDSPKVSSS